MTSVVFQTNFAVVPWLNSAAEKSRTNWLTARDAHVACTPMKPGIAQHRSEDGSMNRHGGASLAGTSAGAASCPGPCAERLL